MYFLWGKERNFIYFNTQQKTSKDTPKNGKSNYLSTEGQKAKNDIFLK